MQKMSKKDVHSTISKQINHKQSKYNTNQINYSKETLINYFTHNYTN